MRYDLIGQRDAVDEVIAMEDEYRRLLEEEHTVHKERIDLGPRLSRARQRLSPTDMARYESLRRTP